MEASPKRTLLLVLGVVFGVVGLFVGSAFIMCCALPICTAAVSDTTSTDYTPTYESSSDWTYEEPSTPTPTPAPTSHSLGVTKAGFDAIETGMTYEEVVAILGKEGELSSSVDIGMPGMETKIYTWHAGVRGSKLPGANMNVTFQGGEMVMKAQAGLR